MSPAIVFATSGALGYAAWLLCFRTYVWPKLKTMEHRGAHRAIATLHSFRFFGLAVLLPGVVGTHFPPSLALAGARWDLATAVLATLTLLTVTMPRLYWFLVIAFNLVGATGVVVTYYQAVEVNLPAVAGEFGAAYAIPVLYTPAQLISHVAAFYLLLRSHQSEERLSPKEARHA